MKKKTLFFSIILGIGMIYSLNASGQNTERYGTGPRTKLCGTAQYENYMRSKDPDYDKKRAAVEENYQKTLQKFESQRSMGINPLAQYTIPVVVHVIYNSAGNNVSDNQVKANISQLNLDWSRQNADAGNTPAAFLSVAADMQIQFCLATKDPSGNPTTGIVHKSTTIASFGVGGPPNPNDVDPVWDYTKYLNIYVAPLSGGLFGYAMGPPPGNGFVCVIDDGTCGSFISPGSNGVPYGYGRTLIHEIGHNFSLNHIWADEPGCGGSDGVADTPNQADATGGCPSGVKTDACTPGSPGIMYMNYMDYTDDDCTNMQTAGQRDRAQSAVAGYLMSLVNAVPTICGPQAPLDAAVNSVITPSGVICSSTFAPIVKLMNAGSTTLTSCTINYRIDANPNQTFNWTGSLAAGQSADITLPSMTTTAGTHTFTSSSSNPNSSTDGNTANDQSTSTFTASSSTASLPLVEGMENATFPPTGWALSNPDNGITWARTTAAAKTGSASMWVDNTNYNANGQLDEFTSSPFDLAGASAASLTFELAYQMYSDPASYASSDSLRVFISTDCGITWTKIYNKGHTALTTTTPPFSTTPFVPIANQWRQETIDLTSYASPTPILIKFQQKTDYENNLYVDDINITSVVGINEVNLNSYVSVFPNPSTGNVFVNVNAMELGQVNVKIYNVVGEVVSEINDNIKSAKKFRFDLSQQPDGMYFVEVKSENAKAIKKLILNK